MKLSRAKSPVGGDHVDPLWRLAMAGGRHRTVEAGAMLFEQGEAARYAFFVVSGRLDVFRKDGRWRVIWSRGEGDIVSFDCAGRRELSCQAAERTELIAIERDTLFRSGEFDRTVAARLEQFNADELRILLSTLGDASRMPSADVIEFEAGRCRSSRPPSKLGSHRREIVRRRQAPRYHMASS